MTIRILLLAVLCTGCAARQAVMISKSTRRGLVEPPHEAYFVETSRGRVQVFLDTGDTVLVAEPRKNDKERPSPDGECPARGEKLVVDSTHNDKQAIVLVPKLESKLIPRRELVVATNPYVSLELHGVWPTTFNSLSFTKTCDHFVFEFDNVIYVGNVATRLFTYVTSGSDPEPALGGAR